MTRTARSPEEAIAAAQQEASDELASCAIEHACRATGESVLSSAEGKRRLLARTAALLAYAYVDFVERYGGVAAKDLRAVVIAGVAMHAPAMTQEGGKA